MRAAVLITLLLVASSPALGQAEFARRLRVQSSADMVVGGKTTKLKGKIEFDYRLRVVKSGSKRYVEVILDRHFTKVLADGTAKLHMELSRDRYREVSSDGKEDLLLYKDAPSQLQEALRAIFGTPLARYAIDAQGREQGLQILAKPAAKGYVETEFVHETLRFFHGPIVPGVTSWKAKRAIGIGSGNLLRGELTYTPRPEPKDGKILVDITGRLTGSSKKGSVQIQKVLYEAKGGAAYDPQTKEWVRGKIKFAVSGEIRMGKEVGVLKGKVVYMLSSPKKGDSKR
ncbi:MAG: hypothetical protein JKY65_07885 [Planctomycetes bacterium]|nr:hypothetical protein [Planctomycetota bacterium]